MFLTEWDQEKILAQGRKETENIVREGIAKDMLIDGEHIEKIVKYSRLAENKIRALANTLKVTVL